MNPGVDRLKQTHGSRLAFHELPVRIRKAKRSDVLLSYDLWNTLDAEIVLACVEINQWSSRRRVDGVEEDATIQHERAGRF